jgi:hypothetical protein
MPHRAALAWGILPGSLFFFNNLLISLQIHKSVRIGGKKGLTTLFPYTKVHQTE